MTRAIVLLAAVFALAACENNTYRGAAIEGWVVDAETKRPLKDVIVVLHVDVDRGGFHPDKGGRLVLQETVTDEKGRYAFPEAGPLKPEKGFLNRRNPHLVFFRRGYSALGLENDYIPPGERLPEVTVSHWNGKTVELPPYRGTLERYWVQLIDVRNLYPQTYGQCDWKKIPRMTAEQIHLEKECLAKRVSCTTSSFEAPGCRDLDYFLREYLRGQHQNNKNEDRDLRTDTGNTP